MSLASIWINDGTRHGKLMPIAPDKAVDIWNTLKGHTEPSEAQAEFLNTVRDVFIPPSYRDQAKGYLAAHQHASPGGIVPSGYDAEKAVTEADIVPEGNGVLQGMSEIIPRGDR